MFFCFYLQTTFHHKTVNEVKRYPNRTVKSDKAAQMGTRIKAFRVTPQP